jgi:hypothetical protein
LQTYVVASKLSLVLDEEVLPEGRGAGLWQRVDVPVVEELVGFLVRAVGWQINSNHFKPNQNTYHMFKNRSRIAALNEKNIFCFPPFDL